jgi:cell division septum initiation protein DivIVA
MPSRVHTLDTEKATAEAGRIIAAAQAEADRIIADARQRAAVYESERDRSVQRLAAARDEYERLSSQLRALKEATEDMMTTALRDHQAIRQVFSG